MIAQPVSDCGLTTITSPLPGVLFGVKTLDTIVSIAKAAL